MAGKTQTTIDSLDILSPTLRQLVEKAERLFQESDTAPGHGTPSPGLLKREGRSPILVSFGSFILQDQIVPNYSMSYTDVSFLSSGIDRLPINVKMQQLAPISWSSIKQAVLIKYQPAFLGTGPFTNRLIQLWTARSAFERSAFEWMCDSAGATQVLVGDPTSVIELQVDQSPLREASHVSEDVPDFVAIGKNLHTWLGLNYEELASITSIGKTTFFDWKRASRTPRPKTVQHLLRVYALARAMVSLQGATDAAAWFRSGQPAPLDLLRQKDFEAAEQAAASVLFRPLEGRHVDYAAFAPDPEFDIVAPESPVALRRAPRKTRRGKLSAR